MRMKLSSDCITFFSLTDFNEFIRDLGLVNHLQLLKPIADNTGSILYKEDIAIKQSALDKLLEMEGQYKQVFMAKMTDEVMREMAQKVANSIVQCLELPDNILSKLLFDGTRHNYRSYILNSFQSKKLIMVLYKILHEKPDLFDHLAGYGLLCMGIVIPLPAHIKMIHRCSFLTGVCADLGLMETEHWREPIEDVRMQAKAAKISAKFLQGLGLPEVIPAAVLKHVYNPRDPDLGREDPFTPELRGKLTDDDDEIEDTKLSNALSGQDISDDEMAEVLREVLKIARFVHLVKHKFREKGDYLKELIGKLAYNGARGYFANRLAEPVVGKFREYEQTARFMIRIAGIERKCLYPPSAWAYPKPTAAQILCRNRLFDCPNMLTGRDIHVVADNEAFGWIGLSLEEGKYPKCKLEEELLNLSRENLK